ncbi:DDE-1 domain-containing protein [Aphis craccivora]|uniref:DDE-1 domain-containing protein n=1 Tax=Aphis craccivora TaxID=307492 RepID=A0A6G0W6S9_APHCR|nr:DDE-1 domain-containing protein [Aphis craccivora]
MRKKKPQKLSEISVAEISVLFIISNFDSYAVCKTMFLNTLGINEWMVHNWLAFSNNGLPIKNIVLKKSIVGDEVDDISPKRSFSFRHDHLNNWFDSLAKMPSHYCRKKTKRLYLEDYVKIIKSARKNPSPYESINLEHIDFYDFKNLNFYKSIRHGKVKGDPEVRDIRALKYDPIHKNFFYKIHFDDDYKELPNYRSCTKKADTAKKLQCLYKSSFH